MDFSMLDEIVYWNWFVLALVLFVLEVLVTGRIFLWMAISALLVGAVLFLAPQMEWQHQILLFVIFSITSIILSRIWLTTQANRISLSTLNRDGSQYIDKCFVLDQPIVNGVGRIRLDDYLWRVSGPDLPAGSKIIVERVDGTILVVKAAIEQC
jgi:membrane protein implicated in regulation of membrane protease activity